MKYIKHFNRFALNESEISYSQAAEQVLQVMKNNPNAALNIYSPIKNQHPEFFQELKSAAEREGITLEAILDDIFKKDPTLLHHLDSDPETKAEVLQRTELEDFSRLGRLSKLDLF